MGGTVVWLERAAGMAADVGPRAGTFGRLAAAGLPTPRGFALGRAHLERFAAHARKHPPQGGLLPPLPAEVARAVSEAMKALGPPVAVRRSPLAAAASIENTARRRRGGRPDRETFLNLHEPAEAAEAVRRIWAQVAASAEPAAIIVQRFVAPEACAVVQADPADEQALHVESSYGIGDLLAAGLVVPDRHTLDRRDGRVLSRRVGRKAQMTVPRRDGGVTRIPVPPARAQKPALDDATLVRVGDLWRRAEDALGRLLSLSVAVKDEALTITAATPLPAPAPAAGGGDVLLG